MSAENPADTVIEAVALAIGKHRRGSQEAWDEDRRLARALHDAGLLADPADRDERRNEAYRAQLARADRAEAEVAELRATVDRVRALADRWDRWGHDGVPIRPSTAAGYIRDALDPDGGES